MALKRKFTEHEAYGLTQEERKIGEKYLRRHKTAGKINEIESLKLFELFLIGSSFRELSQQFPQYEIGKIILTCALRGWMHDRETMMSSLKDRVRAKVIKSVLEQVDFLTTMLGVTNTEHLDAMRRYMMDPENNPIPDLRVKSIKEYHDIVITLQKIMSGSTPGSKTPSILDTLSESQQHIAITQSKRSQIKKISAADEIEAELAKDNDNEEDT
jgi:hypothetical protein